MLPSTSLAVAIPSPEDEGSVGASEAEAVADGDFQVVHLDRAAPDSEEAIRERLRYSMNQASLKIRRA